LGESCKEFGTADADEAVTAEVDEDLRTSLVGLDLLDREDALEADLVNDADEIGEIGLLGHLQNDLAAELLGVL
jgi:hypothetical protein